MTNDRFVIELTFRDTITKLAYGVSLGGAMIESAPLQKTIEAGARALLDAIERDPRSTTIPAAMLARLLPPDPPTPAPDVAPELSQ